MIMTKNTRAQATIPYRDTRNLSCLAWTSPHRGAINNKNRQQLARVLRISHGIARAIENLRELRLSLVPCPDPRERVLAEV